MQSALSQTTIQKPRYLVDVIEGFLYNLENVRHLSPHTIFHYGHDLTLFMRYISSQTKSTVNELSLADITTEMIDGFLVNMKEERNNSERSIKRRLSTLRSFCTYTWDLEVKDNPALAVPLPSISEKLPDPLSKGDVLALLRAARAHAPNPARDYAILQLFLYCGARLSEVLQLTVTDVLFADGCIRLGRNTTRDREILLPSETIHSLFAYLMKRPDVEPRALFLNRYKKPITKGAIYHSLARSISAGGLRNLNINVDILRHTCFTKMAREGFSPAEIMMYSGLHRIHTPKLYTKLAQKLFLQEQEWRKNNPIDQEKATDS